MSDQQIRHIRAGLLVRGYSMASVARELGVSRQHVRDVVVGRATSARVRAAITEILGRPAAG